MDTVFVRMGRLWGMSQDMVLIFNFQATLRKNKKTQLNSKVQLIINQKYVRPDKMLSFFQLLLTV